MMKAQIFAVAFSTIFSMIFVLSVSALAALGIVQLIPAFQYSFAYTSITAITLLFLAPQFTMCSRCDAYILKWFTSRDERARYCKAGCRDHDDFKRKALVSSLLWLVKTQVLFIADLALAVAVILSLSGGSYPSIAWLCGLTLFAFIALLWALRSEMENSRWSAIWISVVVSGVFVVCMYYVSLLDVFLILAVCHVPSLIAALYFYRPRHTKR